MLGTVETHESDRAQIQKGLWLDAEKRPNHWRQFATLLRAIPGLESFGCQLDACCEDPYVEKHMYVHWEQAPLVNYLRTLNQGFQSLNNMVL